LRSQSPLRVRPRHAAAGALAVGTALTAAAFAVAAPGGASAPAAEPTAATAQAPTAKVKDRRLRYGQQVVVDGRARARAVVLQYASAGRGWREIGHAAVSDDGRYRLAARMHASGAVRVVAAESADTAAAAQAERAASRAQQVAVAAQLVVRRRTQQADAGAAVKVAGVLLPRTRGHRVTVEGRVGGRWKALAHARTRANGHFSARVASRLGTTPLRVRSAAMKHNVATQIAAGAVQGFRASLASWYGIYGGPLACGGSLGYGQLGVAHKSLPCGTKVTIRYRGRQVTVPVIDRGPYVGGREWDLTGATARTLGFDGVGVIRTNV
jgi:rare lipoprotein A